MYEAKGKKNAKGKLRRFLILLFLDSRGSQTVCLLTILLSLFIFVYVMSSNSCSSKCSVICDCLQPHGLLPTRLLCPWDSPGKNTGVGCHSLLQRIFPTQVLNLSLLHCRQILYCLSYRQVSYFMSRVFNCTQRNRENYVYFAFPFMYFLIFFSSLFLFIVNQYPIIQINHSLVYPFSVDEHLVC